MGEKSGRSRDFAIAQGALRGKTDAIWKSRLQNGNCWFYSEAVKELESAGLTVKVELLEGPMAEAILRVAETRGANLIVLGARGSSSLQGLLLGSVSQKVIQYTTCPVLVVR